MRNIYWSSYVCSSDLADQSDVRWQADNLGRKGNGGRSHGPSFHHAASRKPDHQSHAKKGTHIPISVMQHAFVLSCCPLGTEISSGTSLLHHRCAAHLANRSEEHTSELQSLMRSSYAVFCLKKKTKTKTIENSKQLYIK